MPYINLKFFNILFKYLLPEEIITIFTYMLLEKSVNYSSHI
jgi:hypothetical protein